MVAWAWGVSRIIDALEKTPEANIDPSRIAVTGCSRNGKGALLAGALDERIVLTIPQESGAGGSASWRVVAGAEPDGRERPDAVQRGRRAALVPGGLRSELRRRQRDQAALRSPHGHGPRGAARAARASTTRSTGSASTARTRPARSRTRSGKRSASPITWATGRPAATCTASSRPQQRAILEAYVKKFLVGAGSDDTAVLRAESANADLDSWMEWTPPTLQ